MLRPLNLRTTQLESLRDSKFHLFDVGAAFANDVFVKLLEDGYGEREAVLNLQKKRQLL